MKKKMTWFMHHNTAHEGHSIQCLLAEENYEAICLFWVTLELVSKWSQIDDDGHQSGKIEIPLSVINKIMGWKSQRSLRNLRTIFGRSLIDLREIFDGSWVRSVELCVPKWLEFQEIDKRKRKKKPLEIEIEIEKEINTPIVPTGDQPKTRTKKQSTKQVKNVTVDHAWVRIWNELVRGTFPLVESLSNWRAGRLAALAGAATDEEWAQLVRWSTKNPWLRGEPSSNGKRFTGMSIDTLLRDSNFHKYLEQSKSTQSTALKEITLQPGESAIDLIRGFNEQA